MANSWHKIFTTGYNCTVITIYALSIIRNATCPDRATEWLMVSTAWTWCRLPVARGWNGSHQFCETRGFDQRAPLERNFARNRARFRRALLDRSLYHGCIGRRRARPGKMNGNARSEKTERVATKGRPPQGQSTEKWEKQQLKNLKSDQYYPRDRLRRALRQMSADHLTPFSFEQSERSSFLPDDQKKPAVTPRKQIETSSHIIIYVMIISEYN